MWILYIYYYIVGADNNNTVRINNIMKIAVCTPMQSPTRSAVLSRPSPRHGGARHSAHALLPRLASSGSARCCCPPNGQTRCRTTGCTPGVCVAENERRKEEGEEKVSID